jgi:hypothetical protein
MERSTDLSEPLPSIQSTHACPPTVTANHEVATDTSLSSNQIDVKESEDIPEPVARLLDRWLRARKGERHGNPAGAMSRPYAENAVCN